jgi:class 3 adenylate cyclase/tetratricopeptide (TPR) repeat protein
VIPSAASFIPTDRRYALAGVMQLPERAHGSAIFADVSGFTALTEALAADLGPQRGAEELTLTINRVYDALIGVLDAYGGSVIGFAGDAITGWIDGDDGLCAVSCALGMQEAMTQFASLLTPSGTEIRLSLKVAAANGAARRMVVGDPGIQLLDVLAGRLLDSLADAEHHAERGEVVLAPEMASVFKGELLVREWRSDPGSGRRYPIVDGLNSVISPRPWQPLTGAAMGLEQLESWLLPEVRARLEGGRGGLLAELRPIVALFMQFSGIDYDSDPNAGAQLNACISEVQRVLERYGGSLMQVNMGDKGSSICAAFGAPTAHEDDAYRAAAAASELRSLTVGGITDVRVGVAQGNAYSGAYGASSRQTYGVLGDAVNLAARLMTAAAPGQALASQPVPAATAEELEWRPLGPMTVKGKREPVDVASLVGAKERQALRSMIGRYSLPMVGRQRELADIAAWLRETVQGEGRIIGVTAEAGMGKSRLTAEALRAAQELGLAIYGGSAESYGTTTSYLAWHAVWRDFFNVDPSAPAASNLASLQAQLQRINPALVLRAPLLGPALNLSLPDNDLTRSFDAGLRKSSLESLLADVVRHRARGAPILFVLEDGHWLDPLSLDLAVVIGRVAARAPVSLLIAYRPPDEQRNPMARLAQAPHFVEVRLHNFSESEAAELIEHKLAAMFGAALTVPPALVTRLTERSEGNPFYIEELLNFLQDREVDPTDTDAILRLDLPASLQRLILARIDQLPAGQRTTLRIASVIGRQFASAVLLEACPEVGEPAEVQDDLRMLSKLELTKLEWEQALTYVFRHIVTREVSYESLLFAMRSRLHEQIGRHLETIHASEIEQHVDILAYHYDHSENTEKRREYLARAGALAQATYANAAAIEYYQKLLPLLSEPEHPAVLLRLGKVYELTGRWREAADTYTQALELATESGALGVAAQCETAIGELYRKRGDYNEASRWLDRALVAFEQIGDDAGVGQVLQYAGSVAAQRGDFASAQMRYEASLEIRRRLDDGSMVAALLSNLGIVARYRGDYEAARTLHEEGLALRRELRDRRAIAISLSNLGNVALDQHDFALAQERLEEAVALQREVGDKHNLATGLNNLGNVMRTRGQFGQAGRLYAESLVLNRELGDNWQLAYLFEDIGVLAAMRESYSAAFRLLGAADALRDRLHAPLSDVERAKLEGLLSGPRAAAGDDAFAEALAAGRGLEADDAVSLAYAEAAAP